MYANAIAGSSEVVAYTPAAPHTLTKRNPPIPGPPPSAGTGGAKGAGAEAGAEELGLATLSDCLQKLLIWSDFVTRAIFRPHVVDEATIAKKK
jgi:hypothetical protein